MDPNPSSSKVDGNNIEKKRKLDTKALYSTLASLVPHQSSKEALSMAAQIEGATNYIKKLRFDLENLKRRKEHLLETSSENSCGPMSGGSRLEFPGLDVRVTGSAMEVVFITGKNGELMFREIVRMLHEEGAEIVMANFSMLDEAFFCTMHCKADYGESSQDYAAARISGRLRSLVCDI